MLPAPLLSGVAWLVVAAGVCMTVALCMAIASLAIEWSLKRLGLWRDMVSALFDLWERRRREARNPKAGAP